MSHPKDTANVIFVPRIVFTQEDCPPDGPRKRSHAGTVAVRRTLRLMRSSDHVCRTVYHRVNSFVYVRLISTQHRTELQTRTC